MRFLQAGLLESPPVLTTLPVPFAVGVWSANNAAGTARTRRWTDTRLGHSTSRGGPGGHRTHVRSGGLTPPAPVGNRMTSAMTPTSAHACTAREQERGV